MAITAQEVNKLRQITGAGMMDCKKALTEADGDIEKAIDILRKKGQKVSASRSDRETTEGAVFIKTSEDGRHGSGRRSAATEAVLIALTCETDFVAKNDDFQATGQKIVEIAFEQRPNTVEELLQLKFDGSPRDNLTVGEKIVELVGKIGEKIEIGAYESLKGEVVVPYIHSNSKLGVIVALKNVEGDVTEAGKNVAMQIAAMRPVAVDKDGVDQATIDRELEIGREQAVAEGKPEHILDKIAQGKLNKFFKDSTLLNQDYVKDPGTTVAKYLDSVSKGLTVSAFKRIAIGE